MQRATSSSRSFAASSGYHGRTVATFTCPRCNGEHDAPFLRCTCGYDSVAVAQARFELATHLRNRKIALGSIPAGVVMMIVTFGAPSMVFGIAALLAGPVIAYVANTYVREARKLLGGTTTAKRLPTARVL